MQVREIVVSRSARVNLGNYEGLEQFVSMKAELDELDDVQQSAKELSSMAEKALVSQLLRSYHARGKKDWTAEKVARHHGLSWVPKEQ